MPKVKEPQVVYKVRRPRKTSVERVSARDATLDLVQRMNPDAGFDDIMYGVYVLEKIDNGLQAIEEGRVISHEEMKRRLAKWLK